jgi:hypothetical protein
VRIGRVLEPKQPRNLKLTLGVSAVLVATWGIGSALWPWSPTRGLGLAMGVLAALLFVFEMLYAGRRVAAHARVPWRPGWRAQSWAQAHVYLGVVALAAVLAHTGFGLPSGPMGWALLLLSLWTTVTGLVGVLLQKWIPAVLAEGLRVEALYERIPELVQKQLTEADALMVDSSDVLDRFYRNEVRPRLEREQASWAFLLDVQGGRERSLEPLRRIATFVDAEEKSRVEDLMSIYVEKLELDAHHSLQGLLRRWLVLHVPPAGLLMGLLAIHVLAWAHY